MSSPDYVFPALDNLQSQQTSRPIDTSALYAELNQSENDNLTGAVNAVNTSSSSALTYTMYLDRNKTISDMADNLTAENIALRSGGAADTYARQGEINEWEAQNKLDTLFFLQCVFLYITTLTVFVYISRKGLIPSSTFYWILTALSLVLAGILWNRANYTANHRDKRYWNRRKITLDASLSPSVSKDKCSS